MPSRRLVIDVSVLISAGTSNAEVSRNARLFLTEVYRICHRAVVTERLKGEWKREIERWKRATRFDQHFTETWLAEMQSRGKISRATNRPDSTLLTSIRRLKVDSRARIEMELDLHLVEAALFADGLIVSHDAEALALFRAASATIERLGTITWAPIGREPDAVIDWLRNGARPVSRWRLNKQARR